MRDRICDVISHRA